MAARDATQKNFAAFFKRRFPEACVDDFTQIDGTVKFYTFVRALMLRTKATRVLDFGAGRGGFCTEEAKEGGSLMRADLQDLRYRGAQVTACDVDSAVVAHPCSDFQVVIESDKPLPWHDCYFDLIVSDMVFEHIESPQKVCGELIRILRPGGFVCARTPNKWGYVAFGASLIPNSAHSKILGHLQPARNVIDVFPTHYKLNDIRAIKREFSGCSVYYYMDTPEPRYHFNSRWLFSGISLLHKLLPGYFAPGLCVFIEKPINIMGQ